MRDERYTCVFAVVAGDLAASVFLFTHAPQSPLCLAFTSVITYSVQHLSLTSALWLLSFGIGWLFVGPAMLRVRQNLSTKLRFLALATVVGLGIDNLISFYQASAVPDLALRISSQTVFSGMLERSGVYVGIFWGVVGLAYVAGRAHVPGETPPPRFGPDV